jgi:DNA-binding transcriptional MerR regulator
MPDSINEQHTFAPHDVAGMFNVSVMTVRRWADYHKLHLSDVANPSPGKARAFSWADVEKFRQIKAWRDAGLSVEAINNRLSGIITEAVTANVMDGSFTSIQNAPDALESMPASILVLDAITTLQRDVAALKASSQTQAPKQGEWFSGFGFGFIAALLFVLLLLALFALRNYL